MVKASTAFFGEKSDCTIELDVAYGLVYITHKEGSAIVVPRERVKRFEPIKPIER